jgi:hypothetical protein
MKAEMLAQLRAEISSTLKQQQEMGKRASIDQAADPQSDTDADAFPENPSLVAQLMEAQRQSAAAESGKYLVFHLLLLGIVLHITRCSFYLY